MTHYAFNHADIDIDELERQIVDDTIATAIIVARSRDVGTVFPSSIVGLREHPELFSSRVYARLEADLIEEANREKLVQFVHMYNGSSMCEFVVHRKEP